MTDQIGSGDDPSEDARANRVFAEFYMLRASRGDDADFTPNHYQDLLARGWSEDGAACLAALCHERKGQLEISKRQLDDYVMHFGISAARANREKLQRLILEARAAACQKLPSD